MPTYTGTQIARSILREIGVLDPIENGHPELINDTLDAATDLLDAWRIEKLLVPAVVRSVFSLAANTQSYTIGPAATFAMNYPSRIECWSVIPNDAASAATLLELPRGRPLTWDQWQQVRVKGQTGAYPERMFFDDAYAAGMGACLFHPIPLGGHVDVVLYCSVAELTALTANGQYNLRPGYARAIKTNGAIEIADRHGRDVPGRLVQRAATSKGMLKRANIRPLEAQMRAEFSIGGRGRRFNVYTGSA